MVEYTLFMDELQKLKSDIQRIRQVQLEINKKIVNGKFKIPIHLGLGHEALAAASVTAMCSTDSIFLTHRNIHFQIALGASLLDLEDEYLLKDEGLASGKLGSMNLMNPEKGNSYTSNILGNNLAVALGYGLTSKIRKSGNAVWVVTGDGAIEEGTFYESLLIASSLCLPIIYIIENNEWSLATKVEERRVKLDLNKISDSLSLRYSCLESNDSPKYLKEFRRIRQEVTISMKPQIIEVKVQSLGGYEADIGKDSQRYVNYHSGAVRIEPDNRGILVHDSSDPLFVALENQ